MSQQKVDAIWSKQNYTALLSQVYFSGNNSWSSLVLMTCLTNQLTSVSQHDSQMQRSIAWKGEKEESKFYANPNPNGFTQGNTYSGQSIANKGDTSICYSFDITQTHSHKYVSTIVGSSVASRAWQDWKISNLRSRGWVWLVGPEITSEVPLSKHTKRSSIEMISELFKHLKTLATMNIFLWSIVTSQKLWNFSFVVDKNTFVKWKVRIHWDCLFHITQHSSGKFQLNKNNF